MRRLIALCILVIISEVSLSQENKNNSSVFEKGASVAALSIEYGINKYRIEPKFSPAINNSTLLGGNAILQYEIAPIDNISIGVKGNFGYSYFKSGEAVNLDGGIFVNYHFYNSDRIDMLIGANYGVGFFDISYWEGDKDISETGIYMSCKGNNYGLHYQFRYFFNRHLGLQLNSSGTYYTSKEEWFVSQETIGKLLKFNIGIGLAVRF